LGEFIRFLVAGAVNTGVTYVLYLGLLQISGYLVSYSVAFGAGIVISYFLNSIFVFRTRASPSSFLRFPLVYAVQYLVGAAVLWTCVEKLGIPREFALVCSIAASVPVTYLVARFVLTGRAR
jgi:putative flippase GtrA